MASGTQFYSVICLAATNRTDMLAVAPEDDAASGQRRLWPTALRKLLPSIHSQALQPMLASQSISAHPHYKHCGPQCSFASEVP